MTAPNNSSLHKPEIEDELKAIIIDGMLESNIVEGDEKPLKFLFPRSHFNQILEMFDRIAIESIELLYWKYKELNDQSVDVKFAEAYGIILDELKASLTNKPNEDKGE